MNKSFADYKEQKNIRLQEYRMQNNRVAKDWCFTKIFHLLMFVGLFLGLTACPDENQNLVNPPSSSSTVLVRAINLSGDKQLREVKFNDFSLGEIPYLSASKTINPPEDSVDLKVYKNAELEFKQSRKQRFTRNLRYTLFLLPSAPQDSIQRDLDTVISLATSVVKPNELYHCNVRIFNALKESNETVSLKQGCQNGQTLGTNIVYRSASAFSSVYAGKNSFTITKIASNLEEKIGTFELVLEEFLEYTFVVARDEKGEVVVYLLDDNGKEGAVFQKITPLTVTQTEMRLVNLAKGSVGLADSQGNSVVTNVTGQSSSAYNLVTACGSSSLDKFNILSNGKENSFYVNLELNQKYTTLVYEDGSTRELNSMVVKQFREVENWSGKAIVRVINLYNSEIPLTVSVGVRNDYTEKNLNYRSGELLAAEISYQSVSQTATTQAGYFPITVFSATQPMAYLTGAVGNIESDKSYLLIVEGKDGETPSIKIIEDYYYNSGKNETNNALQEGVFFQVVNANTESLLFPVTLKNQTGNIITDANLYFGSSFSGVLQAGDYNIQFGNAQKNIHFEIDKRPIIAGIGTKSEQSLLDLTTSKYNLSGKTLRRRFVNVTEDVSALSVYVNSNEENTIPEITGIQRLKSSDYLIDKLDNKMTLYFRNTETQDSLGRETDIKLSYNKGYTLIYTGKKPNKPEEGGYKLIIQQEF